MASYVSLESIPGIRLPNGQFVSTPTLYSLLASHLGARGPPLTERPSVAASIDDPHLITKGRFKGRLQYLAGLDASIPEFFRYYRHGKYLSIRTLQRTYFPTTKHDRSGSRIQDRYVKNLQQYGKDALAHACIDSGLTLQYESVTRFLAETLKSPVQDWDTMWDRRKGEQVTADEQQIKNELWVPWFKSRCFVEEWLRLPE